MPASNDFLPPGVANVPQILVSVKSPLRAVGPLRLHLQHLLRVPPGELQTLGRLFGPPAKVPHVLQTVRTNLAAFEQNDREGEAGLLRTDRPGDSEDRKDPELRAGPRVRDLHEPPRLRGEGDAAALPPRLPLGLYSLLVSQESVVSPLQGQFEAATRSGEGLGPPINGGPCN